MAVRLSNDPVQSVLRVFRRLYPRINVSIWFVDRKPNAWGTAEIDDRWKNRFYVEISTTLPYAHVPEVVAHELAHCVTLSCCNYGGHGKQWKKIFSKLHRESIKEMFGKKATEVIEELKKKKPEKTTGLDELAWAVKSKCKRTS